MSSNAAGTTAPRARIIKFKVNQGVPCRSADAGPVRLLPASHACALHTASHRRLVCCLQLPSIKERKRKRSVYNSETLVRSVRFLRYCLVCSASLVRAVVRDLISQLQICQVCLHAICSRNAMGTCAGLRCLLTALSIPQAPWGLAMAEVAAMLLLYFVAVPSALLVRRSVTAYSYGFDRSLEDVVALSLARGLAVTVAYFTGAGAKHHKWVARKILFTCMEACQHACKLKCVSSWQALLLRLLGK